MRQSRGCGGTAGWFHKVALGTQRAVDLIGGNLQVLLALFPRLCGGIIPGVLAALQQVHGAQHIALDKDLGVFDAAVNMAFGCKVDDIIRIVLSDQVGDERFVADVALHKDVTGVILDVLQVLEVAGIGQLVEVDEADVLILFQHIVDKVRADKPAQPVTR